MKVLNLFIALLLVSTSSFAQKKSGPIAMYDEFWNWVDKNYFYFDAKKVDWNAVYQKFAPTISNSTSEEELFKAMDQSILALKDGHSVIYKQGKTGSFYDYKAGYEIHDDFKVVKKNYVIDSISGSKIMFAGLLEDNIGYIRLANFSLKPDFYKALSDLKALKVEKIIIDIRSNGGGNSNPVPALLSQFVTERLPLGAYVEKTGPGHNDVTKPIWIYTEPKSNSNWNIPIVVLINRVTYSASSYFAGMVKGLPNMKLLGQTTGGGAGGHLGYQLSNGWLIRVSVSDFIDKDKRSIELGVEPDIYVENTKEDIKAGIDKMLEKAMEIKF
jgi:C-terminal processing protease CtpA/Prc